MSKRKGPKGIVPRRKQKSGYAKRTATVDPTPELLRQKAASQGVPVKKVNRHQSSEAIDLLYQQKQISAVEYRAGQKFSYFRIVAYGRQRITASVQMIHENLTTDHAPERSLTDEERQQLRERQENEYVRACHCLKTMGRREFEAVQVLCVDNTTLDYAQLKKARRGLRVLAEMWRL